MSETVVQPEEKLRKVVLIADCWWGEDTVISATGEKFEIVAFEKVLDEDHDYRSGDKTGFYRDYAAGQVIILEQTPFTRDDKPLWIKVEEELC